MQRFLVVFTVIFLWSCVGDGEKSGDGHVTGHEHTEAAGDHDHSDHEHDHDHSGHDHEGHDHDHNHDHDIEGNDIQYKRKSPPKKQGHTGGPVTTKNASQDLPGKGTVGAEEWSRKKSEIDRSELQPDPDQIGHPVAKTNLPSACSLISPAALSRILNVPKEEITLKDGSGRHSPNSQSCFFRWTHDGIPNSGVLIQVQDNPMPDEFPEWASYYVAAKINQGDQMPDGSGAYKYRQVDGLGSVAAYSSDLGRYIWRMNNDYVFMIAFNLPGKADQKIKWAEAIGNEVLKNF